MIHIENDSCETILKYDPSKQYQSVLISTLQLQIGKTIHIMVSGGVTGSEHNNLFPEGVYSDGNEISSFTIKDIITQIGKGGMNRGW